MVTHSEAGEALDGLDLHGRSVHRRAVEAVIWGMPAVNLRLMIQAAERVGMSSASNQIVYWSGLLDWRNQTLTPNPDVCYFLAFLDLADGPVVLEIPPADDGVINGSVMDCWQAALEDVGPAGRDEGKGGSYVILPPDHDGSGLPRDSIPLRCHTRQAFALLRSIPADNSPEAVSRAVEYGRRMRLHPLAAGADASPALDAAGRDFDAVIPYDLRFFRCLDDMVQREPWLERDRVMIDQLRTLGIERGGRFAPDAATTAILEAAVREAHALLDAQYVARYDPAYAPGARWAVPLSHELVASFDNGFTLPDAYPVDARGSAFTFAFFGPRHLGKGQFYLLTIADRNGDPLDGSRSYRLTVPAGVPVSQYWSLTAYDRETHALIRDVPRAGRSSLSPELTTDPEGTVTLHLGPTPPPGGEGNWIPTHAGRDFELLFRCYGPQAPLLDRTWVLPDVQRL